MVPDLLARRARELHPFAPRTSATGLEWGKARVVEQVSSELFGHSDPDHVYLHGLPAAREADREGSPDISGRALLDSLSPPLRELDDRLSLIRRSL